MTHPNPLALPRRRFLGRLLAIAAGAALPWRPRPARAATQSIGPYLGEIMLISFGFAPRGWALCDGQLLSINQNQALFSLLGTAYGGDGQLTFALPDLRGRVAIHQGQGPGLTLRNRGDRAGEIAHTLTLPELPVHTHVARGTSAAGTSAVASATVAPARNPAQIPQWSATHDVSLGADAIATVGGSQPHENRQPHTTLNFVIALQGTFPSP